MILACLAGAAACGVKTNSNGKVKVVSVDPSAGEITGGTNITILGSGFDDGSGTASVVFGTGVAEVVSLNDTAISVKLPSGVACGGVDVQVTNGNGSGFKSDAFSYNGGTSSLTVTGVSPSTGELAGNTSLTIDGSGFSGGVGITIGGLPLRNIQIVSDVQITATTPPNPAGGVVDLLFRNCASQASLPSAFVYTSGLNGGLAEMNITDYVNPLQFAAPTPQSYVDPYVSFVQPTTEAMLNPIPADDTCTLNYSPPAGAALTYIDAGPAVHLTSGGQAIDLALQTETIGPTTYFDYFYPTTDTTAFQIAKYVPGGTYDFTVEGGALLDGFATAAAFSVPPNYNVTAPAIFAEPKTQVARAAMNWAWSGGSPTSPYKFQIFLIGYDNTGAATNKVLYCLLRDDGAYQISGADIGLLTTATTQLIVLTRKRSQGQFLNLANGSLMTTLTYYEKVGYVQFP